MNLFTFERGQDAVVILSVLANPRVAIVNVRCVNVLVCDFGKNDKPLLKKLCAEAVVGTRVREIDYKFKWFAAEGLEREDNVIDE